jgi:N-acyl-D-aspartate/D-glutamate deacylase
MRERAELVRALDAKMKTLPPETQAKVTASLETIRKSIADIQAALGKDPGNALLQALLVNSYQDEMRVLTVVHEADSGREI